MWRQLPDDKLDPISLEPVNTLEREPVELIAGMNVKYYFDADLLAAYLLSSGRLEHPVSRRRLTRRECVRTDSLRTHGRGGGLVDLYDAPEKKASQEADEVLRALFGSIQRRRGSAPRAAAPASPASPPVDPFPPLTAADQPARFVRSWDRLVPATEDFPELPARPAAPPALPAAAPAPPRTPSAPPPGMVVYRKAP